MGLKELRRGSEAGHSPQGMQVVAGAQGLHSESACRM